MADDIFELILNSFEDLDDRVLNQLFLENKLESLIDYIEASGVDLSEYTEEEINEALEEVLEDRALNINHEEVIDSIMDKIEP